MLTAINPQNTSLATGFPVCHSQGELLYHIGKNNIKEVFIDKELPGNLSLDAFIQVVKTKYPDVEISVIEPYVEAESEVISTTIIKPQNNVLKIAALVVMLQTVFSLVIQYSSLTPMDALYAIAAGAAALVFIYGGCRWRN